MVAVAAETGPPSQPDLITNLLQWRHCADQKTAMAHSFRIVAEVCVADSVAGILVLRDATGVEFVQIDLRGQKIEPGTTICLEGNGYGVKRKGFGLAVVPGMIVDADGLHGAKSESGMANLHAGMNAVTVHWFNNIGNYSLSLEYESSALKRQRIPGSALWRTNPNVTKDKTNFLPGLRYQCYEGAWDRLPDFSELQPVKTGVATNFDIGVRTQNDHVGLEFSGFLDVPKEGTYTFHLASDDGSQLFVGQPAFHVTVLSNGPPVSALNNIPSDAKERSSHPLVKLEGEVSSLGVWSTGGELQLQIGNNQIRVEVFQGGDSEPNFPSHARVLVSGVYEDAIAEDGSRVPGVLLAPSWKSVSLVPSSQPLSETIAGYTNAPITTVADVKTLASDQARKRLPVSIRGVVTGVLSSYQGAVVQDSTGGIFVSLQDFMLSEPLQPGEACQIEGVTDSGLFAPIILAHRIDHLGAGQLPQPRRATWNQLMNGSLDTQYGEIEGAVIAVHGQQIILLMGGGKATLNLNGYSPRLLSGFENSRVRIRGCYFGPFNAQTGQLEPGVLNVSDATVQVLQKAPPDIFDAPQRKIGDLQSYDPNAAPLRLLKVSGQITGVRGGGFFLSDGISGLHVTTRASGHFEVGDLVDAVGYLELGGPTAELTEAVMRKTGAAPLPTPTKVAPDHLLQAKFAGTLVQVDATLMNSWEEGGEYVLVLQSSFLTFKARVESRGQAVALPPSGSRVELTGAYAPQGQGVDEGNVGGFELLLSSPAGIHVLSTPPWWNLKRMLILAGVLAALLCAVLLWNKELHRKVQERGRQLEIEIGNRQQAELKHATEVERSRIARDLHDELGTGLTEVSLLASAGLGELSGVEKKSDRFHLIADRARDLVSGLDVIVWAIDPKHNTLRSLADYLESYTKELLSASGINCRFRIPIEWDTVIMSGSARHSLLLAIKESLNNVIRHGAATEVELQMVQSGDRLTIIIADNGCGFDPEMIRRGHGLANLQNRMEAMGGQCDIDSQPRKGTTVKLIVPLARNSS